MSEIIKQIAKRYETGEPGYKSNFTYEQAIGGIMTALMDGMSDTIDDQLYQTAERLGVNLDELVTMLETESYKDSSNDECDPDDDNG